MNHKSDSLARDMDEWFRAIDRFMNRMQQVACTQQPTPSLALECWRPAVNIYETQEDLIVLLEIASIEPEDLNIWTESDQLLIKGQRSNLMQDDIQTIHQFEIWSGAFACQIPLPVAVNPTHARADYQAGLLKITLTKRSAAESTHHQGTTQTSVSIQINQ